MSLSRRSFLGLLAAAAAGAGGCGRGGGVRRDFDLIIGSRGHTSGKFNRPRGICWHRVMNSIYVLDWDGRVQRFTREGVFKASWLMPAVEKGKPEDICVTPDGNLLVADTHYSRVVEFSPTGDLLHSFGSYGKESGQFIYPVGIVCDSGGHIYVSEYGENDRIQKFDRRGRLLASFGSFGDGPEQVQRPSGIDVFDGRVYVADAVNHRIQIFRDDGTHLRSIGSMGSAPGAFRYPYDVGVTERHLYVLEYNGQRVQKLDHRGRPIDVLGAPGRGAGSLYSPWRFTVADDSLFISDTQNNRVVRADRF